MLDFPGQTNLNHGHVRSLLRTISIGHYLVKIESLILVKIMGFTLDPPPSVVFVYGFTSPLEKGGPHVHLPVLLKVGASDVGLHGSSGYHSSYGFFF